MVMDFRALVRALEVIVGEVMQEVAAVAMAQLQEAVAAEALADLAACNLKALRPQEVRLRPLEAMEQMEAAVAVVASLPQALPMQSTEKLEPEVMAAVAAAVLALAHLM